MQSPYRLNIPIPLSDDIQVTVPSGPHQYPVKSWVGSISQGNTSQQAFESLSRHATPFQGGVPSVDGGVMHIPIFGPVRQMVDPDHLTIVNTTLPGHLLYPGNVFRSVVQEGDNLYVVTQGYGTGVLPGLNETVAVPTWKSTDFGIRRELNPYNPYNQIGYPMDEMNAVTGVGDLNSSKPPGVENGTPGDDAADPRIRYLGRRTQ